MGIRGGSPRRTEAEFSAPEGSIETSGPEPESFQVTEFSCVTPSLAVRSLDASLSFYTELLGFTVDTLWPREDPTLVILDRGPVSLLLTTEGCTDETPPTFTGDLRFDVSDVSPLASSLEDHVDFEWGPEVYHYGRREFGVRDPDGYLLIFSETTSEPPTVDGSDRR